MNSDESLLQPLTAMERNRKQKNISNSEDFNKKIHYFNGWKNGAG